MQPLKTTAHCPASSSIGWAPASLRSMIARRRCPSATGPSCQSPAPSGPRGVSASVISAVARRSGGEPSKRISPHIPHMPSFSGSARGWRTTSGLVRLRVQSDRPVLGASGSAPVGSVVPAPSPAKTLGALTASGDGVGTFPVHHRSRNPVRSAQRRISAPAAEGRPDEKQGGGAMSSERLRADRVTRVPLDRSVAVLRSGYPYLLGLRREAGADTVETRFLGRRTIVLSGAEGARLFYDDTKLRRRGAIPLPLRRVLFGVGAVHGLDDADHQHRKALFRDLLTPAAAKSVAELADNQWRRQSGVPVDPATIFDEAVHGHVAAICDWAGVPAGSGYPELLQDLIVMVDGFGSVGPRYVRA